MITFFYIYRRSYRAMEFFRRTCSWEPLYKIMLFWNNKRIVNCSKSSLETWEQCCYVESHKRDNSFCPKWFRNFIQFIRKAFVYASIVSITCVITVNHGSGLLLAGYAARHASVHVRDYMEMLYHFIPESQHQEMNLKGINLKEIYYYYFYTVSSNKRCY